MVGDLVSELASVWGRWCDAKGNHAPNDLGSEVMLCTKGSMLCAENATENLPSLPTRYDVCAKDCLRPKTEASVLPPEANLLYTESKRLRQ